MPSLAHRRQRSCQRHLRTPEGCRERAGPSCADRQSGYPYQMLLTPNPPHHDHWLAKEFPEDNTHPDHRYIRTTVYDNRVALGEAYIQALEAAYPVAPMMKIPPPSRSERKATHSPSGERWGSLSSACESLVNLTGFPPPARCRQTSQFPLVRLA